MILTSEMKKILLITFNNDPSYNCALVYPEPTVNKGWDYICYRDFCDLLDDREILNKNDPQKDNIITVNLWGLQE